MKQKQDKNRSSVKSSSLFLLPLAAALFSSPAVVAKIEGPGTSRIEIQVPDEFIPALTAKDDKTKTEVPEAKATVYDDQEQAKQFSISVKSRGQGSIKFPRKNLAIEGLKVASGKKGKLKKEKLKVGPFESKELFLSAGAQDPLLLKNMIAYRILQASGIETLESAYTGMVLNGRPMGLYMVTKSPAEHLLDQQKFDVVLRRRYNDVIELKKAEVPGKIDEDEKKAAEEKFAQEYIQVLSDLHHKTSVLKGDELVAGLSKHLDLEQYLKMIAVNYILKNGDYTDEVFFAGYRDPKTGVIKFQVLPWDMDDTFKEPHLSDIEQSINHQEPQRIQSQMIYNFESRLDQAISENPVLLGKYFEALDGVVQALTSVDSPAVKAGVPALKQPKPGEPAKVKNRITQVFDAVGKLVAPYISNPDVLKSGLQDEALQVYTESELRAGLEAKQVEIQDRVDSIQKELAVIKTETQSRAKEFDPKQKQMNAAVMQYAYEKNKKKEANNSEE